MCPYIYSLERFLQSYHGYISQRYSPHSQMLVFVLMPRSPTSVSMGRPYNEKYADVKWETNGDHLQAWKQGKTGVPIVDAVRYTPTTQSLCFGAYT